MNYQAVAAQGPPLLEVANLATHFRVGTRAVPAVRNVTFEIRRGEMVGLVGESGCGKSVTALSILRLLPHPPACVVAGSVRLDGADILQMTRRELLGIRGRRIAMVFQDPFSSLNPTMTLGAQIMEAIRIHTSASHREALQRAISLLRSVRIPAPEQYLRRYPHEVSGGQRQRVMIAMAFACQPDLILADEPTTALDVTVQAQVLALMTELRRETGTAILLITHDLGVVAETCDRVLVMYAGSIVEEAPVDELFRSPRHPYTRGLLASLPSLRGSRIRRLPSIPGQPPVLTDQPSGCAFSERCSEVMPECRHAEPERVAFADGTAVRCHLYRPEGQGSSSDTG